MAVAGQGARDDGGEVGRQRGAERARIRWRPFELGAVDLDERAAGPRQRSAGEGLPRDGAEGVDVGAAVDVGRVLELLGRHEGRRTEGEPGARAHAVGELGDPEVEDLDEERGRQPGEAQARGEVERRVGEEEVLGLEVAMDDACGVRADEGAGDLGDDQRDQARVGGANGGQPRVERLAAQVLEHEIRSAVGREGAVEHLDDVGVAQASGGPGLGDEAVDEIGADREVGPDLLDDDLALEHLVTREEDAAHPAFAEEAKDGVAADGGGEIATAGHGRHEPSHNPTRIVKFGRRGQDRFHVFYPFF